MNEDEEFEALAHIYWDRENACFVAFIPNQIVGKARVSADLRGSALRRNGICTTRIFTAITVWPLNSLSWTTRTKRPRACISSSGGWNGTFPQCRPAFPAAARIMKSIPPSS
jgi:hypothetical protein